MIKNIVLDMGNVLMDYDPQVPLNAFVERETDRILINRELFCGSEWVLRDLGNITREEMFERVGKRVPLPLHEQLRRCVYEWQICMTPIQAAQDFCAYIRERGYGMYVLSNASSTFYEYFPRFSPLEYFDGVLVSSDIHMIKPDVKIYEYFLHKYGLKAEECLFIDDREDNIAGAKQAGMQGIVFKNDFHAIKEKFGL